MMQNLAMTLKGVIVPMVTPLTADGEIDRRSSVMLIDFLLDNQTIPFILGTTGEAASMPVPERDILIDLAIEKRRDGFPVLTGLMGLTVPETIDHANKYFKRGIDAVVVTLPYHFELTENQIFNYFNHLSRSVEGTIIIYNIPKTVHKSIPLEVIDRLSHNDNIIGIKDSEPDKERLSSALKLWRDRNDFFHFTGTNSLILEGLRLGSRGIVPSSANFLPGLYVDLYKCCIEDKYDEAEKLYLETAGWSEVYQDGYTLGESLAALKIIMNGMGLCPPHMMPPLSGLGEGGIKTIKYKVNHYMRNETLKFRIT